jgi:hypothetical protein
MKMAISKRFQSCKITKKPYKFKYNMRIQQISFKNELTITI